MSLLRFLGLGGTADSQEHDSRATHEEKLALLHCLFAVSSADQTIAVVEDNEIRRISRELRIEHADYIAARLAHREHLGVLKADEPSADSLLFAFRDDVLRVVVRPKQFGHFVLCACHGIERDYARTRQAIEQRAAAEKQDIFRRLRGE